MKHSLLLLLCSVFLFRCTAQNASDQSVTKIITVTEYALIDHDFTKRDTVRQQKLIKKYDKQGNLLQEMDYWGPTQTFGGGLIYKYNENSKKTDAYLLDIHQQIYVTYKFVYANDHCDKLEVKSDGSEIKRESYVYDNHGNVVRETTYYDDGKIMLETYRRYNDANQEIEQGGTLDGKALPVKHESYDRHGNLIEFATTDGGKTSVEKFVYEDFDTRGNWKIRKSFMNGIAHKIAVQDIVYK